MLFWARALNSTDKVSAVGIHALWGSTHVAEGPLTLARTGRAAQACLNTPIRAPVLLVPDAAHLARTNRRILSEIALQGKTFQTWPRCPHRSPKKVGTSPFAATARHADLLMFRHRSELPILESVIKFVHPCARIYLPRRVLMLVSAVR